jgi:hypothetical protein
VKVRRATPATIVIIYKSGPIGWGIYGSGSRGDNNGQFTYNADNEAYPPDEPSFYYPVGVAVDTSGNMYVADAGNNQIRKVTPAGFFSTFAGSGNLAEVDGTGAAGNLYVADESSAVGEALRKITPAGVVTTLCNNCLNEVGGIVVDSLGQNIYSTEYTTSVVDKISIF